MNQTLRNSRCWGVGIAVVITATAQRAPTASLSGRVLSEDGRALRATLTLNLAAARGYPSPPRRVRTDATGAFSFSRLPAGTYKFCAQIAAAEAAPANAPYIDTCDWPSPLPPVTVAAGQQVAGVLFTAPKGAWLKLHVADPDHALPPTAAKPPAPLEPELQCILKGPDGLYRHARHVSTDNSGRHYQIAIPLKTALSLKVTSTAADVFDQNGNQKKDKDDTPVQLATSADPSDLHFTVHKKP
jgi:hypothetical protein